MEQIERLPSIDDLSDKTIPELEVLLKKWGKRYSERFNLPHEEYLEIQMFYCSCSMMHENLMNGWRRWWRITIPVTESRFYVKEEQHD